MKRILLGFFAFLLCSPVYGQSFSDDPSSALGEASALAQEIISDPLKLEGLQSIVFRYNRARIENSPAGYEQSDWFDNQVRPLLFDINSKSISLDEITPLPDEQLTQMLAAFDQQQTDFENYFDSVKFGVGLSNISSDQMLSYLSAYAAISYTVDSSLWEALSSLTGVWPLCFWNQ
ncbi:hypothetical protein [Ruegeria atlantica]|uniref:hypothetical protein n=1 Tax=Ruegeria atlantica TaxID=81569 RepID=UPI00147ED4B6|nr:hypothetical protein [Ruegeria atlantica]